MAEQRKEMRNGEAGVLQREFFDEGFCKEKIAEKNEAEEEMERLRGVHSALAAVRLSSALVGFETLACRTASTTDFFKCCLESHKPIQEYEIFNKNNFTKKAYIFAMFMV